MRNSLLIAIFMFMLVALCACFIVLNKGHIGEYSLVQTDAQLDGENKDSEKIVPQLKLELDKEILSSKNKKDVAEPTLTVGDEVATDGVTYVSSDEKVVKIGKDNEIIPVADGKATITATYDGMDATANIKVITPITSMTFTSTNSVIRVGKDLQMKLQVKPSDASVDTLTYTSSDEEIALVDNSGIVTGVAPGKVTITVFDSYTETEKKVNLTVKK